MAPNWSSGGGSSVSPIEHLTKADTDDDITLLSLTPPMSPEDKPRIMKHTHSPPPYERATGSGGTPIVELDDDEIVDLADLEGHGETTDDSIRELPSQAATVHASSSSSTPVRPIAVPAVVSSSPPIANSASRQSSPARACTIQ